MLGEDEIFDKSVSQQLVEFFKEKPLMLKEVEENLTLEEKIADLTSKIDFLRNHYDDETMEFDEIKFNKMFKAPEDSLPHLEENVLPTLEEAQEDEVFEESRRSSNHDFFKLSQLEEERFKANERRKVILQHFLTEGAENQKHLRNIISEKLFLIDATPNQAFDDGKIIESDEEVISLDEFFQDLNAVEGDNNNSALEESDFFTPVDEAEENTPLFFALVKKFGFNPLEDI